MFQGVHLTIMNYGDAPEIVKFASYDRLSRIRENKPKPEISVKKCESILSLKSRPESMG
jgi:hypothetical protein